ncbi:ESX secretion-associated protein EspG [Actinophytocola sp.]|uniref:ESX secretion-associated protein EspG n=1 Tax=Actinophytocola sp. TaxID=1872138 RepID=UPI003D6A1A4F
MITGMITLTLPTVLRLVAWRGGEPHTALADTPAWRDPAVLAEVDERAAAELAEWGLPGSAELEDLLDALVLPRAECYGWITTTDRDRRIDYRVLAVAGERAAFVLTVADELVTIVPVRASGLVAEVVARLPGHPPARGRALNAPRADVDRIVSGVGPAGGDLGAMAEILRQPRVGGGSLYSAVRPRARGRRRVPRPVVYVDTPGGRWLTGVTTNPGQAEWVTVAPAGPGLLATRLEELHRDLTGQAMGVR